MPSTKPYFSTRSGHTFVMVDMSATVDSVFIHLLPDGFKYQVLVQGPYRAAIVCDGSGDETTPLQTVYDHAGVDEVVFDQDVITINGTLNCGGKRMTIKEGARITGTGTISGAIIDYNWYDDAIDSGITLSGCTHISGVPIFSDDASADARSQTLYYNGTTNRLKMKINGVWGIVPLPNTVLPLIIDGGGVAITTGVKFDFVVPFNCTVTGWTILGDQTGSIVVDLWQDIYANFPPTVADTITGANKPTLTSQSKNQNNSISWTLTKDSIIRVNVDSATTVQLVSLNLNVTKT